MPEKTFLQVFPIYKFDYFDFFGQIEAARQVFVTKGISLDKFENDDQSETCAYENADGSTCAKKQ